MFSMIVYSLGALATAIVVTLLIAGLTPLRRKDEARPGMTFAIALFLFGAGPFFLTEVQTAVWGRSLSEVAEEGYYEAGLGGELAYHKVVLFQGDRARLLVVGREPSEWGGEDRPSAWVYARKAPTGWVVDHATPINSDKERRDGIRFPPYW
ncbi:MAG TPA: hypothetical protein DER07_06830 [Armatimonadetes bacterium]|nr:hypothetical protein [Armatimonadota bacterium]